MQENNNNGDLEEPKSPASNNTENDINSSDNDGIPENTRSDNTDYYTPDNNQGDDYDFDNDEDDFEIAEDFAPNPVSSEETSQKHNDAVEEETAYSKQIRKEKRHAFFKKIKIPSLIFAGVIVCTFIAVFLYALSTISDNKIMNNIYIGNLDVSGLSYDEAIASIQNEYLFEDLEITISSEGKSYSIQSGDIGISAIPEETAKKAINYCKSGNVVADGFNAMKLIFSKHVITPSAQVDTEKLDEKLNEFGNIVLGERMQHNIELGDDGMVTVHPGITGYNGDPSQARIAVIEALKESNFSNIKVHYTSAPPDEMTLETFDLLVYKEPVNAKYEIEDNQVNIIPGDTGRYINKEEAEPLLKNIHEGGESVKIPFYVSQPDLTSSILREKLFSDTIASYSTSFSGSTSNRCANVSRAASLINGKVVGPGEVFSFNDTVGHRTTANGFYTAKEYVDGKSVDGIGGGTCQVSSTLYSAVLYADMSIVERLNHMMTVGYIPLGQDATVADGGVDFKFKNSSDYPIKISAYTSGTTITVNIIGTQWSPKREVKISNTSSQSGKNTVVRSVRYVYANGELISTDTLPSSTYSPHEPDSEAAQ